MTALQNSKLLIIGGLMHALVGCGGGDAGSPREQAINTISSTAGKAADASSHVVAASGVATGGATSTKAKLSNGKPLAKAMAEATNAPAWKAIKQAPMIGSLLRKAEENTDAVPAMLDDLDEATKFFLENLLANPQQRGDATVYEPNADKLCAEAEPTEVAACKEFLGHVTVEQRVTGDNAGTLTFKYDNKTPFMLGYAPNSFYLEVYLEDSLQLVTLLDPESSAANETIDASGTVRWSVSIDDDQTAMILFGVMESVHIRTTDLTNSTEMNIDKAPSAMKITANEAQRSASIEFGYGKTNIQTSDKLVVGATVTTDTYDITMEKFVGTISVKTAGDEFDSFEVKHFSLAQDGLVAKKNGNVFLQVTFESPDTKFAGPESNDMLVNFNEAFYAKIFADSVALGEATGAKVTIEVNAAKGTEIVLIESENAEEVVKTNSGQLDVTMQTVKSNNTETTVGFTTHANECAVEQYDGTFAVTACN